MLVPGLRTVTAAWRVMGLARERHFTNDHRVLNRATWSARQGSQILCGLLITGFVPPGATVVLRWSVEVTFEEARAHLGLETQPMR